MAKCHLQDLARLLADKYKEAEDLTAKLGLALADTVLDPEEQKEFSLLKGRVDSALSTLAVSLSAAAQDKLDDIINQLEQQKMTYAEPLRDALDNIADPEIPEALRAQTAGLIELYNNQIRQTQKTIDVIRRIYLFKNIVSNKRKQRKYFREVFCANCDKKIERCFGTSYYRPLEEMKQAAYRCYSIFKLVDDAMIDFDAYVRKMQKQSEEEPSEPVDDMME
ncbi:MAG: hypothetical protein NC218_01630 [Acetobacter sp.]|nr:hypothetical protein [Acetobacter sp.]